MKTIALAAAFAAVAVSPALADYPDKPITWIIPFSAGGGTDVGGRTVARHLEACLGGQQPIVVVNKPGAGGQIGFAELAQAAPDGYTLGSLNVPNIQIGAITKRASSGYTLDSFDYIGTFYASRTTLTVLKDSKYKSMKDVIEDAKAGPVQIGISGIGSDDHMFVLKLSRLTGLTFTTVPLGDSTGTIAGVLGGHVPMGTFNVVAAAQNAEKVRTLAVAAEQPVEALPGVPTMREEGLDIVSGTTHVLGAPKGLPDDVKTKIADCFKKIAEDPAFQADIKKLALLPATMDSAETTKFVMDEAETMNAIWEAAPWE